MHAHELIELGALAALHSGAIVRRARPLPPDFAARYWSAARCRFDRWVWSLREFAAAAGSSPALGETLWPLARPVLEEILASELLTRVWLGVVQAVERATGNDENVVIVRNVGTVHADARRRALQVLIHAQGIPAADLARLNRLRCHAERWTDLLLSLLTPYLDPSELAFDPERTKTLARSFPDANHPELASFWQLLLVSLRTTFRAQLSGSAPCGDLNRHLAASILSCLHEELFDSAGLFRSLWLERLSAPSAESCGFVDQMIDLAAADDAFDFRSVSFGRRP